MTQANKFLFINKIVMWLRGAREQEGGENCKMRSLMICTLYPVLFDDNIEKNEMGRVCSTYGERRGLYRVLVGRHE